MRNVFFSVTYGYNHGDILPVQYKQNALRFTEKTIPEKRSTFMQLGMINLNYAQTLNEENVRGKYIKENDRCQEVSGSAKSPKGEVRLSMENDRE